MSTIVAIGAHHDDVELRSGGTLAKYVKMGWHVEYVVATTTPHYNPWPDEIASNTYRSNEDILNLRNEESQKGASALGISNVTFFDFKSEYWYKEGTMNRRYLDGHQSTDKEFKYLNEELPGREFIVSASNCPIAIEFVSNFLAEKEADIVLTHFPDDGHWEHFATANLVCQAVRQLAKDGRSIKFYAWEQGGEGNLTTSFSPTNFVDISETIDLKCESLMSFVSQFSDHNPEMFAIRARKKAKEYGSLVGMEYAEPFMEFQVPRPSHMDIQIPVTYDASKATCEFYF